MKLVIVTSNSCPHCRKYVSVAAEHVPVEAIDIRDIRRLKRKITGVPYSLLYDDDGVLVREWRGANLEPFFAYEGGRKMKVKFTRGCYDKYTQEHYKKNSVREFTAARAGELIAAGVAREVKSKKTNDTDTDKQ